jgi:hypothetical protein
MQELSVSGCRKVSMHVRQLVLHVRAHLPDILELIPGLAHPLCAMLHDPGLHLNGNST